MKTIISCLSLFLLSLGAAFSLSSVDPDYTVKVNNGIVATNSNYSAQMNAVIAFSTDHDSVGSGMSAFLHIHPKDTIGAIVVTAPFCGSYLGYQCVAPVPEYCLKKVHKSGTLNISGVITPYGLDMNSLRCSFLETT